MAGLGIEFEADGNENDKWMVALTWRPAERWLVDFYFDSERIDGPRDRVTGQVFVAYQAEGLRWAAQYSNQDREDDSPLELASAFIVKTLSERSSLIARVDHLFEPSPRGDGIAYLPYDPGAKATTLFAGYEYELHANWRITPNIVWTRYDRNDAGVRPGDDLHLRLTLFVDFE
jgi:hypothetical protein